MAFQLEEKCRVEMENHKGVLDKEYESLITQFTKELERLQVKHNQEIEKKVRRVAVRRQGYPWLGLICTEYATEILRHKAAVSSHAGTPGLSVTC